MSRIFTFGCSFTNYFWPTWADILARQFKTYQNWGQSGAGNLFIFNSLVECIRRNKINDSDTICVMWSSIAREDRYVNNSWLLSGSIYSQDTYDEQWVNKFSDPNGYLIRDLAFVSAARQILDALGCRYYFFSTVPFECYEDWMELWFSAQRPVLNLYKQDISVVRPSVYETIFNSNWHSRNGYVDYQALKSRYEKNRGPDWPSTWVEFLDAFQRGINVSQVKPHIQDEILNQFNFGKDLIRTDYHPTPLEHLEYLNKVLPEITIPQVDTEWVAKIDQLVHTSFDRLNANKFYASKRVHRF